MREWPEDWQVSLGALAYNFHWSEADLDSLTVARMAFWIGTLSVYLAKVKAANK